MGMCISTSVQTTTSKDIEKQLRQDQMKELMSIKMLLLGTGECGKSTVVKQMQIMHTEGFDDKTREVRKHIIWSNVLQGMAAMCKAANILQLKYDNPDEREADAVEIISIVNEGNDFQPINDQLKHRLQSLWHDSAIKKVSTRSNEYQIPECAIFFLNALERICDPLYIPSDQDMLLSRVPTTGITEIQFHVKRVQFRVFDVGGQRSERRKWVHCFDQVNALIFVSAVSEFDQVLAEDQKTNRLLESLKLYESIVTSHWFVKAAILLFLNKRDLFEQKLQEGRSITRAFKDYQGDNNYATCMNFIKQQFEVHNPPGKLVYVHETCATDTNQVQLVLNGVINAMMTNKMSGKL